MAAAAWRRCAYNGMASLLAAKHMAWHGKKSWRNISGSEK